VAVSTDEDTLRWEIASLRAAITSDWVALASRTTSDPEKRKAVREHLDICTCTLQAAIDKLEALRSGRDGPIPIDLDRLAAEIMPPNTLS
jgi:hypothetical protein